ncbi:MAG: pantetheine-phosphate adenylyltransferase [Rickettsiales bacterium]|nr:pantetheine-phosphate adenylyltransferase [Rickettsiales bacterium]
MRIAIYPGTFDPITVGHIDIIKRAAELFDHLIIAAAIDNNKNPLFSIDERVEMIKDDIRSLGDKVSVEKFDGLLVDFAKERNAKILIRGLRAVSDFEYEFQMFGMNSKLDPNLQTIFLPASETNHFIASKFVKEVARLKGNISNFVSPAVADKLLSKLNDAQNINFS